MMSSRELHVFILGKCTVNTGLLQLRVEKDSTANIQPNAKWPTMQVIGALISTISLLYNARGYVHSLISRLENEEHISVNHFGWCTSACHVRCTMCFCYSISTVDGLQTSDSSSDSSYSTCAKSEWTTEVREHINCIYRRLIGRISSLPFTMKAMKSVMRVVN